MGNILAFMTRNVSVQGQSATVCDRVWETRRFPGGLHGANFRQSPRDEYRRWDTGEIVDSGVAKALQDVPAED